MRMRGGITFGFALGCLLGSLAPRPATACTAAPEQPFFFEDQVERVLPEEGAAQRPAVPGGVMWLLGSSPTRTLVHEDGSEVLLQNPVYLSEHWGAFVVPQDAPPGRYVDADSGSTVASIVVLAGSPPSPLELQLGDPIVETGEDRWFNGCNFGPTPATVRPYFLVKLPVSGVDFSEDGTGDLLVDAWMTEPGAARSDDTSPRYADAFPAGGQIGAWEGELYFFSGRTEAFDLHVRVVDARSATPTDVAVVRVEGVEPPRTETAWAVLGGCSTMGASGSWVLLALLAGLGKRR